VPLRASKQFEIEVVDPELRRHQLVQQRAEQGGQGGVFAAVTQEEIEPLIAALEAYFRKWPFQPRQTA